MSASPTSLWIPAGRLEPVLAASQGPAQQLVPQQCSECGSEDTNRPTCSHTPGLPTACSWAPPEGRRHEQNREMMRASPF